MVRPRKPRNNLEVYGGIVIVGTGGYLGPAGFGGTDIVAPGGIPPVLAALLKALLKGKTRAGVVMVISCGGIT